MSAARSLAPRPTPAPAPVKPVRPVKTKPATRPERATLRLQTAQAQREQALEAGDTAGMLHAEALEYRLLTAPEERALGRRIQAGGPDAADARARLILANIRLVEMYAVKTRSRGRMEFEDLAGAGMFGLINAVERYDPRRGARFSTLAVWWIRQAMERYRDDHELSIHLPAYLRHRVRMGQRIAIAFQQEHGAWPSDAWISDALNASVSLWNGARRPVRIRNGQRARGHVGSASTETQVREARAFALGADSLDRVVYRQDNGAEPDCALYTWMADPRAETAFTAVEDAESEARLVQLLLSLHREGHMTARELKVLGLRFGKAHTLNQIGEELGITRERVRQVEADAMRKLRAALARDGIRSMADWTGDTRRMAQGKGRA